MSKEIGRQTLLNSSPMSRTGLVLAEHSDGSSPDTPLSHKFSQSSTDISKFIVGQKVYVGGTRPGVIAYIGETHFAPGEWVGIVLDDPSGKNDGCVSGKRYFQCEPKRGVFSRLNRLSLHPIASSSKRNSSEIDPSEFGLMKNSRTVSPTPSVQSAIGYKTPGKQRDLQVGDRVIVSSGFGSRPGELKFLGETQFAAGNWCGVQLDEPNGKNDGSVDGVQYFECPSKHGIFVPVAKVSLSPSSKKTNLSRMGSRESLTSVGTVNSVATTNTSRLRMSMLKKPTSSSIAMSSATSKIPSKSAFSMQDIIKEKQQYIEQLMTERELDREDSQNQILLFTKTIAELKEKISSLEVKLTASKIKNDELKGAIDEAQFCGEELTVQNQEYKEKIEMLQKKLLEGDFKSSDIKQEHMVSECQKCILLNKEIEQLNNNTKDFISQIETLKTTNIKNTTIENELVAKEDELYEKDLKVSELEKLIVDIKNQKEILANEIYEIRQQNITLEKEKTNEIEQIQLKYGELQSHIENLKSEIQASDDIKQKLQIENKKLIDDINDKNTEIKNILNNKELDSTEINKLQLNYNQLQTEINGKDIKLKEIQDKNLLLENTVMELKNQKEIIDKDLQKIHKDFDENNKIYAEKELKSNEKLKEIEIENEYLNKKIEEISGANKILENDIVKLSNELNIHRNELSATIEIKESGNKKLDELIASQMLLKKEIDEKINIINEFNKNNLELSSTIEKLQSENENLNKTCKEFEKSLSELDNCKIKEEQEFKNEIDKLKNINTELNSKINILNENTSKLQFELNSTGDKLKNKESENSSALQNIETTSKELNELNKNYETLRKDFAEKEIQLNENLNKITQLESSISQIRLEKSDLEQNIENLKTKQNEMEVSSTKELNEFKFKLEKSDGQNSELQSKINELNTQNKSYENEISNLTTQLKNLESNLTSSLKDKEHENNELNKLAMAHTIVKNEIAQKEAQINEKAQKISDLENTVEKIKTEKTLTDNKMHEIKDMMAQLQKTNLEKDESLTNKSQEIQNFKEKLEELEKEKHKIQNVIKEFELLNANLKIDKETLENNFNKLKIASENAEKLIIEKEAKNSNKDEELLKNHLKVQNLESQHSELISKIEEFERKINEFNSKNTSLLNDLQNVNKLNEDFKTLHEEKENLIKQKIEEIKILQLNLENNKSENIELNKKLKETIEVKNNHENQIQKLNDDLKNAESKLCSALSSNESGSNELNKILTELSSVKENNIEQSNSLKEKLLKVTELEGILNEINSKNEELENNLQKTKESFAEIEIEKLQESNDFKSKLENLNKVKTSIESDLNNIKIQLKTKESELDIALANKETGQNELQTLVTQLNDKLKNLETNSLDLQNKIELITNEKLQVESKNLENQTLVVELKTELEKSKSEYVNEKAYSESLLKKHEKLLEDVSTLDNSCKILKELEEKVVDQQHINDILLDENNNLKLKLNEIEKEKQDAINNAELLEIENDQEFSKIKEINSDYEKEFQLLQMQLQIKNKEISESKSFYEKSNKSLRDKTKIIDQLEIEIANLKSSVAKTSYISNNIPPSSTQIQESDATGQINFLNSIIADMHKKNENLKARIDVLETSPSDLSKALGNILTKRKPAPRLFCDICDEFDQHDTEDCPLQSSDSPPVSIGTSNGDGAAGDSSEKKIKPPPREYCENCEVFGHDTSKCINDECF